MTTHPISSHRSDSASGGCGSNGNSGCNFDMLVLFWWVKKVLHVLLSWWVKVVNVLFLVGEVVKCIVWLNIEGVKFRN